MTTDSVDAGIELLLVEDDPDDARFVEQLVLKSQSEYHTRDNKHGIEISNIIHVDRLVDGLERVEAVEPDIVLLDLMLHERGGVEAVDRLVERAPLVPIVVITDRDETEVAIQAIQHGAEEYLIKGTIDADVLLRTLRYALERKRTRGGLRDRNRRLTTLNQIVTRDIRNAMSVIVGLGDQISAQTDSTDGASIDELLDTAEHVVELTDTAAELIDVLDTDGRERAPCNLIEVIDAEVARLQRTADVVATVERHDSNDESVTVHASPMLGSVITHLLSTAVARSTCSNPQITISVDTTADHASVEIRDDGREIPDWKKKLITDPECRRENGLNMGIDWYLITTALEEIDGELEIDDHSRRTTVTLTLTRVDTE